MRTTNFCDCRNDFSGHTQTTKNVVYCHLVDNNAKNWSKRDRVEKCSGIRQLPNSMDMAT